MVDFGPSRGINRSMAVHVQQITRKNSIADKPNEDALFVDEKNLVFAVADGVSRLRNDAGRYPDPSPASEAARVLATRSGNSIVERVTSGKPLVGNDFHSALISANREIREYNALHVPNPDFGVNDLAGAVGIVGAVSGDILRYAYIGDCLGFLVRAGTLTKLTTNQTESIEAYIRDNRDLPNLEQTIRREIRNNISHPLSWGVLTGEERAQAFIRTGEVRLERNDRVIFCSDGVLGVIERPSLASSGTVEQIIQAMLEHERSSNCRSDDKTVVVVDVKG